MITTTQMETSLLYPIPVDVLYNFDLEPERITRLAGGLINLTYLVESGTESAIIQRLGSVISTQATADSDVYSKHLANAGWEAPLILRTKEGQMHHQDKRGGLWRRQEHITSDPAPKLISEKMCREIAELLGNWHLVMGQLNYRPEFSIPNFHETDYHAEQLRHNLPYLPSEESKVLAKSVLELRENLPQLPETPDQLIHGDPKLNNILFRHGSPFTFIDLDTVMRGPLWLDLGDMARSVMSANMGPGGGAKKPHEIIPSLLRGYYEANPQNMSFAEFYSHGLTAVKGIALELAMRYLNDIIDDNYFGWDPNRFTNKHDHHVAKARTQFYITLLLNQMEEK